MKVSAGSGVSVCVIGSGAMGSVFAAAAARAGAQVTVIDRNPSVVSRIAGDGLQLRSADGNEERLRIASAGDAEQVPSSRFVFVFVKAGDNSSARRAVAAVTDEESIVVTLQNGIGHAETLGGDLDPSRFVVGVTSEGANAIEPGYVHHYHRGTSSLGPLDPADPLAPAETVAQLLRGGGLVVDAVQDVRPAIWRKLVFNSAYSATAALTRRSLGSMGRNADLWSLAAEVARESAAVAAAAGIPLDAEEIVAQAEALHRAAVEDPARDGKASMLIDVESGRRTEIDALNGAVLREAQRLGVAAPLNRLLTVLVRALDGKPD